MYLEEGSLNIAKTESVENESDDVDCDHGDELLSGVWVETRDLYF